ncbi:MAG: N-acetyl-gamma-glutamyl-phosphate reductase [Candidatus Aminicenantaceae bacterium]
MDEMKISIAGGAGYTGGELLRLLLDHPNNIKIQQVTSNKNVGNYIFRIHPNLRKKTQIKFSHIDDLKSCDFLFLCLPHKVSMKRIHTFINLAPYIIDLSSDFRLNNPEDYKNWYSLEHPCPELLDKFIYGIPELHREKIKKAKYISGAGCNATSAILALYPLFHMGIVEGKKTVIEVKTGTSQGGFNTNPASYHPERSGAIRCYKPFGHRHTAEIIQELSIHQPVYVNFTATSIDMVRGVHCVSHVFLKKTIEEKEIWKIYREMYKKEPFIRIIKEQHGIHRFPDSKILAGSNYCDIGFAKDPSTKRLIVMSALDNLMKGAAGQAVQAFNIIMGLDERNGLQFPGLHPI